jgi:hypothetical protein
MWLTVRAWTTRRGSSSSVTRPEPSMSVDLMLPAAEKIVLVLEGISDDEIRVNSSSLDHRQGLFGRRNAR